MDSYTGYALVSMPQSRDRLEDRRSTDDKMPREMWEEVEDKKANKTRIEEAIGEERKERKERNKETDDR